MTASDKDIPLDRQGIPILTEVIPDGSDPEQEHSGLASRLAGMTPAEITDTLLESGSFRHQLDEVAEALTRNARQQVEQALRPIIEEAISQGLDNSGTSTYDTIREQLETALPDIIAQTLQDERSDS